MWEGYRNPHFVKCHQCEACSGNGLSPEAQNLSDKWYGNAPFKPEDRGSVPFLPTHPIIWARAERSIERSPEFYGAGQAAIEREAQRLADLFNGSWSHHLNHDDVAALLESDRLLDLTHTWTKETGWQPKDPPHIPTPEEVNSWSLVEFGHDGINNWIVVREECKRLGLNATCSHCDGEGSVWESDEAKQMAEEWAPTEPPAGDGYQMWETVTDGSPISPVFATPEELAQYMVDAPWGADEGTDYETWLKFINGPGWAPSVVADNNGVRSGVEAVTDD